MKKMTTLYKKDPANLGRVTSEVDPINDWVFTDGLATRKHDGTSCAIIGGLLYKRYDSKINRKTGKRKPVPDGAIPCQEPDNKSGHWPHWVRCDPANPADKWHYEAFGLSVFEDGTYELCGPKVNGNPENLSFHQLVKHGSVRVGLVDISFEGIGGYLATHDIEGIVFHHATDGRMCKIRKSDFGIKR